MPCVGSSRSSCAATAVHHVAASAWTDALRCGTAVRVIPGEGDRGVRGPGSRGRDHVPHGLLGHDRQRVGAPRRPARHGSRARAGVAHGRRLPRRGRPRRRRVRDRRGSPRSRAGPSTSCGRRRPRSPRGRAACSRSPGSAGPAPRTGAPRPPPRSPVSGRTTPPVTSTARARRRRRVRRRPLPRPARRRPVPSSSSPVAAP